MRMLLAAVIALAACATPALAQQTPQPLWRRDTTHLALDRVAARTCLETGADCSTFVQRRCGLGDGEERTPAESRICHWRAIAAWEDEMQALLTRLRGQLRGKPLADLNASQQLWDRSMLADVGLAMDVYEGGSLAGPVGARVRAMATARRVQYLDEYRQLVEQP